jgi:hypothetical protein
VINTRTDRVYVWASQLAANDFPPVCALTGTPAEAWKKFRFATPPPWAYALYVLVLCGGIGLFLGAIVIAAVSERASGFLPLTHGSSRLVTLATWVPLGLIVGSFALYFAVAVGAAVHVDASDANAGAVAGILLLVGVLLLVAGLIGRLVVMPLVSPRGRVTMRPGYYDKLVEIRNVHPAFVAAVNQRNQARAAQSAAMQAPANPSTLPYGST